MESKLKDMNEAKDHKELYELSIGKTLINTKDTIFGILDDLLRFKFETETFTKNNRLYYLGIIIIMIVCLTFLYELFSKEQNQNNHDQMSE